MLMRRTAHTVVVSTAFRGMSQPGGTYDESGQMFSFGFKLSLHSPFQRTCGTERLGPVRMRKVGERQWPC